MADDNAFSKTVNRLQRRFEEQNPGTKLRFENAPGEYVPKMILNFVAGAGPDVMSVDASSAAVFINNGQLRDLRPFMAADPSFRPEDFWPNVMSVGAREKAIYTIPGDFTPMVLYYNKRLFDRARVPYPSGPMNFDQFLDLAKRLTLRDAKGNVTQYGFKFANWMPMWILFLWNNGGDVLSADGAHAGGALDSEENAQAIRYLVDLVRTHKVAPDLSQTAATGVDPFATGTAAMMISGHWELPGFETNPKVKVSDLGVTSVPSNLPQPVTVYYAKSFGIPTQSRSPEAAWKYLRYVTSREFQTEYQSTGIAVCGRKDVAAALGQDPLNRAFQRLIPSARAPWGAKVVGYDFVEQEGVKMMQSALLGAPPREALQQMAERVDAYFRVR